MVLRSFVKINLLFRTMDPLKRKSPGDLEGWILPSQAHAAISGFLFLLTIRASSRENLSLGFLTNKTKTSFISYKDYLDN